MFSLRSTLHSYARSLRCRVMKKLLIPFMVGAMIFTGCSLLRSESTPKDIVNEAFKNLEGMDYYDYEFSFDGEMITEGETVDFSINYLSQQDNTDKTKPKFTRKIDAEISTEEFKNQSMTGEMASDGDSLYFVINEISDFNGELSAESVTPLKGQWFSLSLDNDTIGSLSPFSDFLMTDEKNVTEDQKKLRKLYEDTEFFTDVEFLKTEDGYDVYTGVWDTKDSKKFVEKAMEMKGLPLTGSEEGEIDSFLESVELDVVMYVDKAENVLTKATGTMTMTDLKEVDGVFDFSIEFMNLHEPVVIEIPEDFEEFDPMMIFAAMMGADPTMMVDPAMMDPSMNE